ncbi:hypothetical protein KC573_03325, partial [candidate division WWE3 bacterium]|nr:hypothetical protein [candidate division WWE3 bacterium]
KGITLIELVIYIALTALLLVVNLGILVNILRVRAETIEMQDLDFALNNFSIAITQDLRWADQGVIYNGPNIAESGSTLVISKNTETGTEEIRYQYDVADQTVTKTEPDGDVFTVSPADVEITNFNFENLAPADVNPSIKVTVEGHGTTSLRQTPSTVSTTVSIRHKSLNP